MNKGIKIIFSTISAIIMALIIVPIALSLLLNIDAVQNFTVDRLAVFMSKKAETTIRIDDVKLKLFNRASIKGLYAEDHHGDTLVYIPNLTVTLNSFNPFSGKLAVGDVDIEGAKFYLMQDSTGTTNLKQIIEKLKNNKPKNDKPKKKSVFRLSAGAVTITDMEFKYRKRDVVPKSYGVNFSDIDVDKFNLKAHNVKIINDSISASIENISLGEKSGLIVKSLSSSGITVSANGIRADKLHIGTSMSDVNMTYVNLGYNTWNAFREFTTAVSIEAEIINSTVAFPTIAYFAPGLSDKESVFHNFTGTVSGTVSDTKGRIEAVSIRNTGLRADFEAKGLPDFKQTKFLLNIANLSTESEDVEFLYKDFTRKNLDTSAVNYLQRMKDVSFEGTFDGYLTDFGTKGKLTSKQGTVGVDVTMRPRSNNAHAFTGKLDASSFNIGELLAVKKLGRATLHADVAGQTGGNDFRLNTTAVIPSLTFNGYTYNNIDIKGMLANKTFEGAVNSADPNMEFNFDGKLDFTDSIPAYNFVLDMRKADLFKLNFNRRDSVSVIGARIYAQGSGFTLDNINGKVSIDSMMYINHVDTVRTGEIRFVAENNNRNKLLGMYSSFADVEFKGQLGYNDIISYFNHSLITYLPSISRGRVLPFRTSEAVRREAKTADASGFYVVAVNVKEANNVAGIFMPGLKVAEGTKISFLFNPQEDRFSLTASSDFIERGNFLATGIEVNSRNEGDSISLFMRAEDLYAGNLRLPNLSVIGGAKDNRISIATRFNNKENGTYAMLSTASVLSNNPETGLPQIRVNFFPSTFTVENQTWNIGGRGITIDSTRITVDRFRIANGPQQLVINGTASKNRSDTLHVQLNRFDLTPFSRITGSKGYNLSGIINGHADLMAALKDGLLSADITFDSVRVNNVDMPNTTFSSSWDFQSERARLGLTETNSGDTIISGYYRPTDKKYYARVDLDSINLALLDPVLKGIVRETRGHAQAHIEISNPESKMQMNGTLKVPQFSTVVDYTNVKYTLRNATGEIKNSRIIIPVTTVYDPAGNGGGFDMSLDLGNFSNISYNLHVRPEKMMVLNTTAKDNELFYGTVYASGLATISGNKGGVSMNIENASTENNSRFFLPLGGSATASTADFIQFIDSAKADPDSLSQRTRRRIMLDSRLKDRQAAVQSDMDIAIAMTVRPNAELQITIDPEMDNVIRATGNGRLNIRVNPRRNIFTIYGDYQIAEGSYRFSLQNNLLTKMFIIEQGSNIQWTGDPVDAMLGIRASYKLKASLAPLLSGYGRGSVPVECIIMLSDRLSQPEITFDVQVPNADTETRSLITNALNTQEMMATQFLWLLAANSFYAENGGNQNLNIGAMATSAAGFEFLSSQLSRILSTERFSLVPKYRPKSEVTSDEIGLAFSAELIKDRLTVEVDGNYDTGNNVTMNNRTGLTGDVYINWLLDSQGSVRAKAFTRTIERFDENQGLQESGLGVNYREDFNSMKDLREKIKNRFKRDPKKKQTSESDAR